MFKIQDVKENPTQTLDFRSIQLSDKECTLVHGTLVMGFSLKNKNLHLGLHPTVGLFPKSGCFK